MADDGFFDEHVAATYDAEVRSDHVDATAPVIECLSAHAGGGRALEFAIGTGRVALPLARRGVDVHGIELSRAMVDRMRAKPGGQDIPVTIGDMATTRVDGRFALVYLVFNTIMNLTSQAAQVACFRNAAAHLEPGGGFLVEVIVPRLTRLSPGNPRHVFAASEGHLGVDEYDLVNQGLVSHHYFGENPNVEHRALPCRYVWPAELDLMAELAGMKLAQRCGDWNREPFTADSDSHISVWRTPG